MVWWWHVAAGIGSASSQPRPHSAGPVQQTVSFFALSSGEWTQQEASIYRIRSTWLLQRPRKRGIHRDCRQSLRLRRTALASLVVVVTRRFLWRRKKDCVCRHGKSGSFTVDFLGNCLCICCFCWRRQYDYWAGMGPTTSTFMQLPERLRIFSSQKTTTSRPIGPIRYTRSKLPLEQSKGW